MNKIKQVLKKNNNINKYCSLKGNYWLPKVLNRVDFNNFSEKQNIVSNLLILRNIPENQINNFLNPKLKNLLPDPSTIDDMDKATDKICELITKKKKIGVFGDYDVDGSSATALICNYLDVIGANYEYYIPDRINEGYGPNRGAFDNLKNQCCELVLTLDCGTTSVDPINYANEMNLETIVVDHHLEGDELPNAYAIVNPNKKKDLSELKNLCAAGVSFFLLISINRKLKKLNFFEKIEQPNLLKFLDLVALGTVCDLVKLDLVNRALVKQGMKVFNKFINEGLKSLISYSCINQEINEYHLGFVIGPRINAAGRVGNSKLGASLMINKKNDSNSEISNKLCTFNELRKKVEQKVQLEAMRQVENEKGIICVHSINWHPGVIGIVAGKLVEEFKRPSIVISENNETCKASCRSVKNFHIGDFILDSVKEGLLSSGGGHEMAGGFSIERNKISEFKEYIKTKFEVSDQNFEKNYDLEINLSSVNIELCNNINKLSPFGMGNPKPKFLIRGCIKNYVKKVGQNHLIIGLQDNYGNIVKSIIFNSIDTSVGNFLMSADNQEFDVICSMQVNSWGGQESAELILEDVIQI